MQPGVEMAQAEMRREPLAERALAGGGRPVDRDDHEYSAPSRAHHRDEAREARRDETRCRRHRRASRSQGPSPAPPSRCGDPCGSRRARRRPRGPCRARSGRRPRSRPSTPLTRSIAAVAARRSDSFTRNSFRPRMRVVPSANDAATARIGYSSIIDRRALGRHLDALERRGAHAQIGDVLAAFVARGRVPRSRRPSRAAS